MFVLFFILMYIIWFMGKLTFADFYINCFPLMQPLVSGAALGLEGQVYV